MNFQNVLYSISEVLSVVNLNRNQILFRINEAADNFYIILKGRVCVLKPAKKLKSTSFKTYYEFLINLFATNEHYLFKLNIKANSDIFFASFEEFVLYQHTLKKRRIREILFSETVNNENVITTLKNEKIDLGSSSSLISEEALLKLIEQDQAKFLMNLRKKFDALTADENEVNSKFNLLINYSTELKTFAFFEYENFAELRTKQFFGDFALDAADKKRTATIMATEDTILGCIPGEIYNKHIQAEKMRYRAKDSLLLNNFVVFKHIKQIHFDRHYFQDFAPSEYEKDHIIFKQGELLDKLSIIKSGSIDFYFNASLYDINLLIKNLILKARIEGIFPRAKANELLDKLYDGLNVTNKSTSYFENLVKKKNFLLYTCYRSEAPGIEVLSLGIPFLFKGVVKSDKCKIFKLDVEKMNFILKSYAECKKEYLDLVESKVDNILNRLFNIKKCLVNRYSVEYDLQTNYDKIKIDNQLKILERRGKQNDFNYGKGNCNEDNNIIKENLNSNFEVQKNSKDIWNVASPLKMKNNNNIDDGNSENNRNTNSIVKKQPDTKNFNEEAYEELLASIRPYKNSYHKKNPQPDKIKIDFQELISNKKLIDIQSNETTNKGGETGCYNTKNDFFKVKNTNEAKNSLISFEKKIENSFIKDNNYNKNITANNNFKNVICLNNTGTGKSTKLKPQTSTPTSTLKKLSKDCLSSIYKRARENKIWSLDVINIRDYALDKHGSVDDSPFGGGSGMVMRADVIDNCLDKNTKNSKNELIYLSPRGELLTQKIAKQLSKKNGVDLICGHFEGIDQRVIEERKIREISIGDFILSGGETAAFVLLDSILRLT